MPLPEELIIGTWSVIRSEIPPPYVVGDEFFHFSSDGTHYWEFPYLAQIKKTWEFRYYMTESGAHITPIRSGSLREGWPLPLAVDGEYVVITNPRGNHTWLRRIFPSERPRFLTLYFEPPREFQSPE